MVNLQLPPYIQHSSRPLRGNHLRYIQPATNVDSYKFSFYPASIKLWNSLPPHIADCDNLDEFKNLIRGKISLALILLYYTQLFEVYNYT